jgi:hypothetical protein
MVSTPSATADFSVASQDTPKASATDQKAAGHCPLTAAEAARWLEGMGYPYDTPIYLAGGKPVKGSRIEDLHAIYPNVFSKDTLLSEKELARFQGHPSLLAGLDYQVGVLCWSIA